MNKSALEINDKYCGVISDNGEVRILEKINTEVSFNNVLELENELETVAKELLIKKDDIKKIKESFISNTIKYSLIVLISLLIAVFGSTSSLFLNLLFILNVFLGIAYFKTIFNNISKLKKTNKLADNLKIDLKEIQNELSKAKVLSRQIFSPLDELDEDKEESLTSPLADLKLLRSALTEYIKDKKEVIESEREIGLTNKIIGQSFKGGMRNKTIDAFEKIQSDMLKEKDILELRALRYELLDSINQDKEKQKAYIKKDNIVSL